MAKPEQSCIDDTKKDKLNGRIRSSFFLRKYQVDDELRSLFGQSSFYVVQWQVIECFDKPDL
ncbi:MAG: hypothetical protein JRE28_01585 [Deltaproteobacteria bacterium]|nr:hypothetical protein [Deltaproteobacteria bacterium]